MHPRPPPKSCPKRSPNAHANDLRHALPLKPRPNPRLNRQSNRLSLKSPSAPAVPKPSPQPKRPPWSSRLLKNPLPSQSAPAVPKQKSRPRTLPSRSLTLQSKLGQLWNRMNPGVAAGGSGHSARPSRTRTTPNPSTKAWRGDNALELPSSPCWRGWGWPLRSIHVTLKLCPLHLPFSPQQQQLRP